MLRVPCAFGAWLGMLVARQNDHEIQVWLVSVYQFWALSVVLSYWEGAHSC